MQTRRKRVRVPLEFFFLSAVVTPHIARRDRTMPKKKQPNTKLGQAFTDLAKSLEQLSESLTELSSKLGWPIYKRHGMPFGETEEARRIWTRYRQYTTQN